MSDCDCYEATDLVERIKFIPGCRHNAPEEWRPECGSWHKIGSFEEFVAASERLIELGVSADDVFEMLDGLYGAAANCFGG